MFRKNLIYVCRWKHLVQVEQPLFFFSVLSVHDRYNFGTFEVRLYTKINHFIFTTWENDFHRLSISWIWDRFFSEQPSTYRVTNIRSHSNILRFFFFSSNTYSLIHKSQSYTKLPIDKNDLWSRHTGKKLYTIFNQSNQNGIVKAHKCDLIDLSFHSRYTWNYLLYLLSLHALRYTCQVWSVIMERQILSLLS